MKKSIHCFAAVLALASTQAFAGLTILNTSSEITSINSTVQCNGGSKFPVIFNVNVPWGAVQGAFLGGALEGNCVFRSSDRGNIGVGAIVIANDLKTATATVESVGDGFNVKVSGSGSKDVTIILNDDY
jgi:hypothetical protein